MGWASILGTIGGAVLAPFTGGASLAIGSAVGQAIDSRNAERSAAQQQQDAYGKISDLYAPFYQTGGQATNALAQGFGLEGAHFAAPMASGAAAAPDVPRSAASQYWGHWDQLPSRQPSDARQLWGDWPTESGPTTGGRLADLAASKRSTSSYATRRTS